MEYVWIAGISRVGKATLIAEILRDAALAEELAMEQRVEAFQKTTTSRPHVFTFHDVLAQPLRTGTRTLLLKWQFSNAMSGDVQSLLQAAPGERHRLLVLEAPDEEVLSRWSYSLRPYGNGISSEARRAELGAEILKMRRYLFETPLPASLIRQRVRRVAERFETVFERKSESVEEHFN